MEIMWHFRSGEVRGRLLDLASIQDWDAPFANELLTEEKKEEIARKVIEYAKKRRIPLEIRKPRTK